MTYYTLYIDESGEAGIKKIRSESSLGASPFMTLGAVLIKNSSKNELESVLSQIHKAIGKKKELHCAELSHSQKVYYARTVAQKPIVCFGLISRKSTLGNYGSLIEHSPVKYYNKCSQLLLERVGKFLQEFNIEADYVDIVFEEGLFDYALTRSFIKACQTDPRHPETKYLLNINVLKLKSASKSQEPLLKLADLVAHSLYQTVHKTDRNYNIPEPRYLNELRYRFYSENETGKLLGHGLKLVHKIEDIKFDNDVKEIIQNSVGQECIKQRKVYFNSV